MGLDCYVRSQTIQVFCSTAREMLIELAEPLAKNQKSMDMGGVGHKIQVIGSAYTKLLQGSVCFLMFLEYSIVICHVIMKGDRPDRL